jgi:GTP-binding protein
MFDIVDVSIKAGNGGNGLVSFERGKYMPDMGPDGGNGGNGGNIFIRGNRSLNTLTKFKYKRHFEAENGKSGGSRKKHGKNGQDCVINVPLGTEIIDANTGTVIYEIMSEDQEIMLAKGGIGGCGNTVFKNSIDKAPRKSTNGEIGESGHYTLSLKSISDVGIVGLPNAGKSTFINKITNANSKTGNYEFTTLSPVLGSVNYNYDNFIMADIPGIISGASEGHGLGLKFLRHIERSKMIIYLIDASSNVESVYKTLIHEIDSYNPEILKKYSIVILNKTDLITKDDLLKKIDLMRKIRDDESENIYCVSSIAEDTRDVEFLIKHIYKMTKNDKKV